MNHEEIILQQYKIYTEQKDKFVDRSFQTNKFYLAVVLIIVLTMFLTKDFSFAFDLSSTLIFSAVGFLVCILWWINIDSYNFLIKVKLSTVIEEIEKKLPIKPYTDEFSAIKKSIKEKREFVFADMQKALATMMLLLFCVLFVNEIISVVF